MHLSSDESRRSIRRDLARSSQTGAPPLGHLAGLHRIFTTPETYALAIDLERPLMNGGPGILEIAMLADLALGGAIRNEVGRTLPMPTISMTLQLAPGQSSQVAWADGECTARHDRTALARSRLRNADGAIVGDAQGVFALPAIPYEGPGRAMPWDLPTDGATADTLTATDCEITSSASEATDQTLVDRLAAHAGLDARCAWGTAHVGEQLTVAGDEVALTPTEPMANRLGHIQGGVLFTTAVLSAARQGRFSVDSLVTGTIEFIDAAQLDEQLIAQVSILRSSGRSFFASILLVQGERTCCHVSLVFRR